MELQKFNIDEWEEESLVELGLLTPRGEIIWISQNGRQNPITTMDINHLHNTWAMLHRASRFNRGGRSKIEWINIFEAEMQRRYDSSEEWRKSLVLFQITGRWYVRHTTHGFLSESLSWGFEAHNVMGWNIRMGAISAILRAEEPR